jgi:predicted PurR-regulated permease PerM
MLEMHFEENSMTDRTGAIRWWTLLLATGISIYLCWLMLQPFIMVIAWATVLVIVFYPIHRRLAARIKRPSLAALLSCLLVILIILVPVALITLAVFNELAPALVTLQTGLNALLDPNTKFSGPILNYVGRYVDIGELRSEEFLLARLKGASGQIAGQTLGFLGGLAGFLIQMFFVIFTMYYFFRDGERIYERVRDAIPLDHQQAEGIMSRTREVIDASVYGVVSIAIVQGALGGLAFWVLGLPSAIVWGVAMTLLSLVPVLGAFLVWVPAAIYLAVTGHWIKAVLLATWGTFVIGMVDNFLRPILVGSRTRLHELVIFFAVLGGLKVFGVLGVVLGPVVVAVTIAVVEIFKVAGKPSEAH